MGYKKFVVHIIIFININNTILFREIMAFSPKEYKQFTDNAIISAKVIVPLILQSFHPHERFNHL